MTEHNASEHGHVWIQRFQIDFSADAVLNAMDWETAALRWTNQVAQFRIIKNSAIGSRQVYLSGSYDHIAPLGQLLELNFLNF